MARRGGVHRRGRGRDRGGYPLLRRLITRPRLGFLGVVVAATLGGGALVRQVPRILVRLSAFQVENVRVEGARYLTEDQLRTAAGIVEGTNLWESKEGWIRGAQGHPLVRTVSVRRTPPNGLVFQIEERDPVAFVAAGTLHPVDALGIELPIDPAKSLLDLPIVTAATPDSLGALGIRIAAQELGAIGSLAPDVYEVISEALYEDGQMTLRLGDSLIRLRYLPPITKTRLREAMAAMNDWVARFDRGAPGEIDLRFEDQVVIRARS